MDARESKLVAKTEGFFKRFRDATFRLTAYLSDRTPMDETISADNCLVIYAHYDKYYKSP